MTTLAVVESLDVEEDVDLRFLPRAIVGMMDQFHLQRSKETLHRGVVVAIAATAHARSDAVSGEEFLIGCTRILAAAITVMKQWFSWLPLAQRHLQRRVDQLLSSLPMTQIR